jgi:hypothetical protein
MITNARIVCKGADPLDYHKQTAERGTPEFIMSSGALREFAACPSRWRAGYQNPESTAKEWGALLDCLLTSKERFDGLYAIEPDDYTNEAGETKAWNNNAKVCRKWRDEQAGKEVVDKRLVEQCRKAIGRLRSDDVIALWLDSCDTQIWVAAEWHDKDTGLIVPVKCLLDFVPRTDTEFAYALGDLKSTRNASVLAWQRWCFTAGYHVQAAIYADAYIAATNEDRNTWCFIVQENYEPYQPGKRILSQDFLTLGRATYKSMMENYCQCLKANRWPGYDDTDEAVQGWSLVEPDPWMAERAQFAPRFEFSEQGEPEGEEQPVYDTP